MPITDPAPLSSEKTGSCGRFLNISAFRRTAMPDKTICDTCHILSKLSKTCHKPEKIPPCPLKSMLNFGGFVDRLFRGMNNIVRWGKGRGCFET